MIKTGEIIELGQHRLACGNAKDKDLVNKLMGEDKVRCVLTDPPYGVAYVENKDWLGLKGSEAQHFKKHVKIQGDQLQTDEEYSGFTKEWIECVKPFLTEKNSLYIFNSDLMICGLRKGMRDAGIYYSQLIIWIKNHIVLGRKDYNPQHELIAYGWYGRHKFERSKDKSIIFHAKLFRAKLYPTMKPVGLLRKLLLNSTKTKDWVYDPFGGSGSTLIACEQTGRRCLMIELDPAYCEVIKERYKNYIELAKTK